MSVFLSPPCTENRLASLSGEKLDERGVRFSTPLSKRNTDLGKFEWEKCISLRRILKGGSRERGRRDSSAAVFMEKKKLFYTL